MATPHRPYLTQCKVTIDTMGYIVIRWDDERFSHTMNYHVTSSKRVGWSSQIKKKA